MSDNTTADNNVDNQRKDPWSYLYRDPALLPRGELSTYQLNFAARVIQLQRYLSIRPHDIDIIRATGCAIMENLLMAVNMLGAPEPYEKDPLEDHISQDKREIMHEIGTKAVTIIVHMNSINPRTRADILPELITETTAMVNLLMKISELKNLDDVLNFRIPNRKFGLLLELQKADIQRKRPYLSYELDRRSIYPVKLSLIGTKSEKLRNLLVETKTDYDPTRSYTLAKLTYLLKDSINELQLVRKIDGPSIKRTVAEATHSRYKDVDIYSHKALQTIIINAVEAKPFSQQWNFHHNKVLVLPQDQYLEDALANEFNRIVHTRSRYTPPPQPQPEPQAPKKEPIAAAVGAERTNSCKRKLEFQGEVKEEYQEEEDEYEDNKENYPSYQLWKSGATQGKRRILGENIG